MANYYKLGGLLGCGGMGQVHSARDATGRVVAVKRVHDRLSTDRVFVDRFVEEARLLRNVSHPSVVRVLDHGTTDDGLPYLVMDHASGAQLSDVVTNDGPLSVERVMVISSQVLGGLAAIHDAGIVHADIKSANILVDDVDLVTIIDFGLARSIDAVTSEAEIIAGTPCYMAPEVISGGAPSIASDVYAAATIVYEILTGTTPFSGSLSTILARQLAETAQAPSARAPGRSIPRVLDRVILRALDRSLAVRYASVREFAADLDRAIAAMPVETHADFWENSHTVMRLPATKDTWIDESLARAERLVSRSEPQVATFELETAIATLVDNDPASPAAWRLEAMLAGIHRQLGQHDRARRIAFVAYKRALRSRCAIAEAGARKLVESASRPVRAVGTESELSRPVSQPVQIREVRAIKNENRLMRRRLPTRRPDNRA
ncbi:MAG TPA: serine/threonine-protein kinase [Kofleriaceae bacterium]|nr:serine/threonine-protein kinase [Kofleriaceae bacterium]